MFFYMSLFPELVFAPKYPVLIYVWLIILSLVCSYLINAMYIPLTKSIDNNTLFSKKRYRSTVKSS